MGYYSNILIISWPLSFTIICIDRCINSNNTSHPGISVIGRTTSTYIEPQTTNYFTLEEYGISDRNLKGVYLCIREVVKRIVNYKNNNNNRNEKEKNKVIDDNKNIKDTNTKTYLIINISCRYESIPEEMINKGTISQWGIDPFTSSRSGIKTLTKPIALQLADKEIRVNAIAPGIISTDIYKEAKEGHQQVEKNKSKIIPFRRTGKPEEIAQSLYFYPPILQVILQVQLFM